MKPATIARAGAIGSGIILTTVVILQYARLAGIDPPLGFGTQYTIAAAPRALLVAIALGGATWGLRRADAILGLSAAGAWCACAFAAVALAAGWHALSGQYGDARETLLFDVAPLATPLMLASVVTVAAVEWALRSAPYKSSIGSMKLIAISFLLTTASIAVGWSSSLRPALGEFRYLLALTLGNAAVVSVSLLGYQLTEGRRGVVGRTFIAIGRLLCLAVAGML